MFSVLQFIQFEMPHDKIYFYIMKLIDFLLFISLLTETRHLYGMTRQHIASQANLYTINELVFNRVRTCSCMRSYS